MARQQGRSGFAVIIGTGCGAGVAFNGRAHIGGNGTAGEWGGTIRYRGWTNELHVIASPLVIAVNKVVLNLYFRHGIRDGLSSFERTCAEDSERYPLVEETIR